jgi:hypothetical protein
MPPAQRPPDGVVSGSGATARVTEYSEKDVMNVLELVRKEFTVDDQDLLITSARAFQPHS